MLLFSFVCLSVLYLVLLASITILNRLGADRFWLGALNLYLPQAMWLVPGLILLIVALTAARRWIWLPLVGILWVLGPIMGLSLPIKAYDMAPGDVLLRVMTCNTKYGRYAPDALLTDLARYRPDLLLFQDAEAVRKGELGRFLRTWHVHYHEQFVIASRFPLSDVQALRIDAPDVAEECLRARLRVGDRTVTVYNVHLQTPRTGLNAFRTVKRRPWFLPKAVDRFEANVEIRLAEARALQELVAQERGPVVLAGDLNSPESSEACLMLRRAGLHDAFSEAGTGYGYSYGHKLLQHRLPWIRFSWMRIDHIMMNDRLHAVSCWTGNGESSEHRPVIADLVLKAKE